MAPVATETGWRRAGLPMALCFAAAFAAGCSDEPSTQPVEREPSVCTSAFVPKSAAYQVVGFYPSWKHGVLPVERIRWDALTRVIYAFAIPEASGQVDTSELSRVDDLVAEAHRNGVQVYLSVGGGAGSGAYPLLAADPSSRGRFVFEVADYLGRHCLDGVDIDWESWTKDASGNPIASETNNLLLLLGELRSALDEAGLQLSVDVYASDWFGRHYSDAVQPLVDQVHVMAYDFTGPWSAPGPHSSYEQAIGSGADRSSTGLSYWTGYRDWPRDKTYLGVPFYGRDFDTGGGTGIAYRDIVAQYADAPAGDRVANIYYNGIATIEAKTRFVLEHGYPGVMIWEIAQDADDPGISLLSAIDRIVSGL